MVHTTIRFTNYVSSVHKPGMEVCSPDPCMGLLCRPTLPFRIPGVFASNIRGKCESYFPAMEGSRCFTGQLCKNGECVTSKHWKFLYPHGFPNCWSLEDDTFHAEWVKGPCGDYNHPASADYGRKETFYDCLDKCKMELGNHLKACEWHTKLFKCLAFNSTLPSHYPLEDSDIICHLKGITFLHGFCFIH